MARAGKAGDQPRSQETSSVRARCEHLSREGFGCDVADPLPQQSILPVRPADGIVVSGAERAGAGRRVRTIALGTAALCVIAACDAPAPEPGHTRIEVIDDVGRTVHLETPAARVVSLIPARTDLLLALGAADRLVARTVFDRDPRLAGLPSLGDALTPSVEWLAALQPDLVIAWPDRHTRTIIEQLEAAGVPVYASRVETIEDVRRSIAHAGVLLGLEAAADSVRDRIDAVIAEVRGEVRELDRPSVAYFIGLDPPMAAGPGTFVDEMIGIAGGTNVFSDALSLWPAVSLEQTIARQPDVVIVATGGPAAEGLLARLREMAGWRSLDAVRAGRVHLVDPDLFNRPGPRLIEALRILADRLRSP